MHDLFLTDYEKCRGALEKSFPRAVIKDLGSDNYRTKFSVDLDDVFEEDYYKFLIKSTLSQFSCNFLIRSAKEEGRRYMDGLVREINKEHLVI